MATKIAYAKQGEAALVMVRGRLAWTWQGRTVLRRDARMRLDRKTGLTIDCLTGEVYTEQVVPA